MVDGIETRSDQEMKQNDKDETEMVSCIMMKRKETMGIKKIVHTS